MSVEEHIIDDPQWLKALVELAVTCIKPLNVMGRFGYRYLEPSSLQNPNPCWVIAIYPTPNEAYGGVHDGAIIFPGFCLDLGQFLDGFTQIGGLAWNAPAGYNTELDGPEISVKGDFAGNAVWVRIFSQPPSDAAPTMVVDLATGNYWEKTGS